MTSDDALAIAPPGSFIERRSVKIEIRPDLYVETMAIRTPDSVIIPFDGVLPNGGFARGMIELDPRTYDKVMKFADRIGGVPVIRGLLERYGSGELDFRAMPSPR